MTTALLLALSLAGQAPPAPEADALVAALGSAKSSERDAAEEALERLGASAIGPLEAAADSRDLELRMRAAALLDRIEGRRLADPTLVTLSLQDASPAEAAAEVARQAGVTIGLEPEPDPRWRARGLTINEPGPLPLWDALDRIGRASRSRIAPPANPWERRQRAAMFQNNAARRATTPADLVLRPADGTPPPPTCDSGAFRVTLTGLRLHEARTFARTREASPPPGATSQFTAQMQVRAEPRLVVASIDAPVVTEAVDDRGQSLVAETAAVPPARPTRGFADEATRGGPLAVGLRYPDDPGKTIARLRGSFRALIVGRRGRPVTLPLAPGDAERSVPLGDDETLTIHEVRPGGNPRSLVIQFTVGVPGAGRSSPSGGLLDPRGGLRPPPSARGQIEFRDAQGALCQSVDLGQNVYGFAPGTRSTVMVNPPEGVGPPSEARYYPSTWTTAEVAFDFRDVPMP